MSPSTTPKMRVSYDEGSDVLYVSLGAPRPALSSQRGFGVVVRHTNDDRIVGVTIIRFMGHFLRRGGLSYVRRALDVPAPMVSRIEQLGATLREPAPTVHPARRAVRK